MQRDSGGETTGFQSPAQDHIEHVIDLARVLDLQKPGIYPVRVSGQAFAERGIKDGDILIANTAGRPAHGKVAVAVLQGKLNGLNPELYLRTVLARIADHPISRIGELLPWNLAGSLKTHSSQAA